MSSAILIGVFSLLEIYGQSCGEQDRGWLTGAHALALTCVPCQPTSKLPQAAGTGGGSSGGGDA